jgi:hypothetical protein
MPYHITVACDDHKRREIVIQARGDQREAAVVLLGQLLTTLRAFEQSAGERLTGTNHG